MKKTPPIVWIPALVFTSSLLVFLMVAFYTTPNFTQSQREIVALIFPLLAGFSALFLGGTVLAEFSGTTPSGFKFGVSATAGIAIFLICYFNPPNFVKRFIGERVEGSVDLLFRKERIAQESNPTIRSATVRTGQNGDTKGTRVSFDLPAGAFEVRHKEFWNCDCTKNSRSWIEGNRVIAEGTITSPEKWWGPRVWGELHLDVSWKRKIIEDTINRNTPLQSLVLSPGTNFYSFSEGIPIRAQLRFFDIQKRTVDALSLSRIAGSNSLAQQTSEKGLFTVAANDTSITITRNAH